MRQLEARRDGEAAAARRVKDDVDRLGQDTACAGAGGRQYVGARCAQCCAWAECGQSHCCAAASAAAAAVSLSSLGANPLRGAWHGTSGQQTT